MWATASCFKRFEPVGDCWIMDKIMSNWRFSLSAHYINIFDSYKTTRFSHVFTAWESSRILGLSQSFNSFGWAWSTPFCRFVASLLRLEDQLIRPQTSKSSKSSKASANFCEELTILTACLLKELVKEFVAGDRCIFRFRPQLVAAGADPNVFCLVLHDNSSCPPNVLSRYA